ncbi:MAG: class I SAM-dependent methyltransferase [Dehalococcoidia bacterium]
MDFDLFKINGGERVLDVGCGDGRHSWHVCKLDHCSLYAMDYESVCLQKNRWVLSEIELQKEAKGDWNLLQGNTMVLPFRDGCFDRVICSEVLEHVVDDEQGVRELARVLKEGGVLAVSMPAYLPESIYWKLSDAYHSNAGGHIRIYREHEVIDMLTRNNLTVFAVRHKHAFHTVYWLLRCLFGVRNEKAIVPAVYHKFLTFQLDGKAPFLQRIEGMLDHLFPKSFVVYVRKAPAQEAGA